jgi:hypothetical protein
MPAARERRGDHHANPPQAREQEEAGKTQKTRSWRSRTHQERPWTRRRAALVVGASFSHHARVEGSGRTVLACPTPSRKRPTNQPGTRADHGRQLIQTGRLRWLRRLPLVACRHATVSTVPRVQGQGRPPGQPVPGGMDHDRVRSRSHPPITRTAWVPPCRCRCAALRNRGTRGTTGRLRRAGAASGEVGVCIARAWPSRPPQAQAMPAPPPHPRLMPAISPGRARRHRGAGLTLPPRRSRSSRGMPHGPTLGRGSSGGSQQRLAVRVFGICRYFGTARITT